MTLPFCDEKRATSKRMLSLTWPIKSLESRMKKYVHFQSVVYIYIIYVHEL